MLHYLAGVELPCHRLLGIKNAGRPSNFDNHQAEKTEYRVLTRPKCHLFRFQGIDTFNRAATLRQPEEDFTVVVGKVILHARLLQLATLWLDLKSTIIAAGIPMEFIGSPIRLELASFRLRRDSRHLVEPRDMVPNMSQCTMRFVPVAGSDTAEATQGGRKRAPDPGLMRQCKHGALSGSSFKCLGLSRPGWRQPVCCIHFAATQPQRSRIASPVGGADAGQGARRAYQP